MQKIDDGKGSKPIFSNLFGRRMGGEFAFPDNMDIKVEKSIKRE